MVFAQLLIAHSEGLLQHATSDILLKLLFKVLIYNHLRPLINFSVFLKYYCLLSVVLFQTGISPFCVGGNFCCCTRYQTRLLPLHI